MSRHWKFKNLNGPAGGFYTMTFENADASSTATLKIPEIGVYHGKPQKKLKKTAAKKVGRRINKTLNKNT